MKRDKKCSERVKAAYEGRIEDIETLWNLYRQDCEARTEDGSTWTEYGLSLDYIQPEDGENGYLCFLLSTGGPHEEFRFYLDDHNSPYKIEFWLMDWYDGAKYTVRSNWTAFDTLSEIVSDWNDCGAIKNQQPA